MGHHGQSVRGGSRLVLDAIRTARSALVALPDTAQRKKLLDRADECERAVAKWHEVPPTEQEREVMMKSVLGLHIAATRLRLRI